VIGDGKMPFWDDNRWRQLAGLQQIIYPFNADQIEDANYLLSVGNEIYVSDEESKATARQIAAGESFAIDPGQFAFLLTEETVRLPFDVIGFISIRASIKFLGLVNISGFHVDPGYNGKLIFSVFNAGPARIHLKRGERIFPIWLADLHGKTSKQQVKHGYNDIPPKLINQISGKFTTAYQLEKEIHKLKEDIAALKAFKLHATVVLTIAGALLLPTLADTIGKFFQHAPPAAQSTLTPPNPSAKPVTVQPISPIQPPASTTLPDDTHKP
jgi:dCTP deaminase